LPGSASATWSIAAGWQCGKKILIGWPVIRVWPTWVCVSRIATLNLIGVTGAVLVMIAHGFLAALIFGLSGYVYQQSGTLQMDRLGGLLRRLPFIGGALVMGAFAACGLPGFANFAGEVTVFFGAWKAFRLVTILAVGEL